jgi:hypothetical protein
MARAVRLLYITLILLFVSSAVRAAESSFRVFKTRYAAVHYEQDRDVEDFIWRIGGERISFPRDSDLAAGRVDRVVERVQTILDMHPKNFKVNIYLLRGFLEGDRPAFYDNNSRSIRISVDYSTDGVLAHELAHAVISLYFPAPPPSKVQEILTQYVDKYLWSDY